MGSKVPAEPEGKKEEKKEKKEGSNKMFLGFMERICLQFDMRGISRRVDGAGYFVSAGEMKSGNPQRARKQLRLFLSTKAMVVYLHAPEKVKSDKAMGIAIAPPQAKSFDAETFSFCYKNILFDASDEFQVDYSLKSLLLTGC